MPHKQNTVPKGLCDAFQNEILWQKMCFYIAQILSEVSESSPYVDIMLWMTSFIVYKFVLTEDT